ncbi:dihydrolipoamide acetyltransferase family protein [Zhihengliuella salsuginis]|uniref:Dihydrolipoamide acetyltransferase component of pyruvate dehydrogenase complex n=1 Tax=Zhihengliuella salsuginis TaxID=578222 RepID=A0ABQ3GFP5_9MICC|nr:dihydrolipoamide acetyltransferase family protein [Zhihengliuella salsuginis]GHD03371.1 dihydrolipoamide acetyltransferase component of pyruvate dehydrogenase complex [Zhihengliuella salsuginis]
MSVKTFLLPDLGEGLTEADLLSWHVAVGDTVRVDQPIAEVETAKSSVEVPCPFAGVVQELFGTPGETLEVGKPLIAVLPEGSSVQAPAAQAPEAPNEAPAAAQSYREEERAGASPAAAAEAGGPAEEEADSGSGNVLIGYGTPGGAGAKGRRRMPKTYRDPVDPRPLPAGVEPAEPVAAADAEPGLAPRVINPIVRRLARYHGLSVASLRGTGGDGLVLRADVEAAIAAADGQAPSEETTAGRPAVVPGTAAAHSGAASGEADARTGLGIAERIPVKGVRKTIAAAMTRSRTEIPEATVWVDVDATALLELRASLKSAPAGAPGLLAFIARFAVAGLAKYPELNARVENVEGGQELVRFDGVNLGFAAQTDRGLVVPSIERAEALSARELDAQVRELTGRARDGKCTPTELTRGTFTLNNYGVFGVDGSAAIINYPEAAILGVGRIIDKPWVVDGELAVRKVTELTLAFDHRVCDGGVAGGFLRYVADAIENPGSVLADL